MAGPVKSKEDYLRNIQWLNVLMKGVAGNTAPFEDFGTADLKQFLDQQIGLIDAGFTPEHEESFWDNFNPWAEDPSVLHTQGAKKNLEEEIKKALNGETIGAEQTNALQAILDTLGYKVTFDDVIDAPEKDQLKKLQGALEGSLSLTTIANENFKNIAAEDARLAAEAEAKRKADAAAEAEAAKLSKDKTDLDGQVSAGLVYGGYLDADMANDKNAMARAMRKFINATTDHSNQVSEMAKCFDPATGEPTDYARQYLLANTNGWNGLDENGVSLIKLDLESGLEASVARAQNYMNLHGRTLDVNGKVDQPTFEAGQDDIRKPLTVPAGLIRADGTVSLEKMYSLAENGQLYLPIEKLSAEEQAAAMKFPLAKDLNVAAGDTFSREQVIATKLLKDPEAYLKILDEENARRAGLTLEAAIELPEITVEAEASDIAARNEEAKNPLGLPARTQDENYSPETSDITAAADGVLPDGTLVFSDTEKSFEVFLARLQNEGKSPITMAEALAEYNTELGINQDGYTLPVKVGGLLSDALKYDSKHAFDLTKPEEIKAVLTGVTSFSMAQQGTLKIEDGQNYIDAIQKNHPALIDSIDKVAKGVTGENPSQEKKAPATGPGITDELLMSKNEPGFLTQSFRFAYENLLVRNNAPEAKELLADNDPEKLKKTGTGGPVLAF